MDDHLSSTVSDVNNFLQVLSGSAWGMTACTKTIDDLFQCALRLQEGTGPVLTDKYPGVDFNKSMDLLLENVLKNNHLNEHITLYTINKYINLSSNENLSALLENVISEVELRENLSRLIQEFPNVELDFCKIDGLLRDLDSPSSDSRMVHAVKFETSTLLDSLVHCSNLAGPILINKLIACLDYQTDLRLWFNLFKNENTQAVLKLCTRYGALMDAVLVFFDKFAAEIESVYDEDLNVKYSHVNLDFEEFVNIFQLFLKEKSISETMQEYLDGKTLLDKNYCFWIDLRSCIEN